MPAAADMSKRTRARRVALPLVCGGGASAARAMRAPLRTLTVPTVSVGLTLSPRSLGPRLLSKCSLRARRAESGSRRGLRDSAHCDVGGGRKLHARAGGSFTGHGGRRGSRCCVHDIAYEPRESRQGASYRRAAGMSARRSAPWWAWLQEQGRALRLVRLMSATRKAWGMGWPLGLRWAGHLGSRSAS